MNRVDISQAIPLLPPDRGGSSIPAAPYPANGARVAAAVAVPLEQPVAQQPVSPGLKLFITQAANINQGARIYLFLLGVDMKIADLIANPKLVVEHTRSQMLSHLRPGQTLQASVLTPPSGGIARLRIGATEIMVRTQLALAPGEQLLLDVIKAKNSDQPALRLVQQPTLKHFQAQALRNLLPRQIPLDRLIDNLRNLTSESPKPLPNTTGESRPLITAGPEQKVTYPHQQLIKTLRNLAPETVRDTLLPAARSSGRKPGIDNGLPLSLKGRPQARDSQSFQRLPVTSQSTTPAVPPARVSLPQSPALPTVGVDPGRQLPRYTERLQPALNRPLAKIAGGDAKTPPSITASAVNPGTVKQPLLPRDPGLVQRIEAVLRQGINENDPLTASRIRQAFGSSGLFLESSLAQGTAPTIDMKASLLQLLLHLRPGSGQGARGNNQNTPSNTMTAATLRSLSDLQTLAEGALARVQVHQFASLPPEEGGRQVWQFELPFLMPHSTDNLLIRLEREESDNSEREGAGWAVTIHFNIEPLGPMSVRLSLQEEEISSHFTAQLPTSAREIEEALPRLAEGYLRAGLKVGKLSCRQGTPTDPTQQQPIIDLPLLDEKA